MNSLRTQESGCNVDPNKKPLNETFDKLIHQFSMFVYQKPHDT